MNQAFNKLSDSEAERLALLAEECAEVIQVVGKILRHGYNSTHPNGGMTNGDLLEMELGHVMAAVLVMEEEADVEVYTIRQSAKEKLISVWPYLHHNIIT